MSTLTGKRAEYQQLVAQYYRGGSIETADESQLAMHRQARVSASASASASTSPLTAPPLLLSQCAMLFMFVFVFRLPTAGPFCSVLRTRYSVLIPQPGCSAPLHDFIKQHDRLFSLGASFLLRLRCLMFIQLWVCNYVS